MEEQNNFHPVQKGVRMPGSTVTLRCFEGLRLFGEICWDLSYFPDHLEGLAE